MKDDIDKVLEIARRYGVRVFLHPHFPRTSMHSMKTLVETRGLKKLNIPARASSGPTAHHCDVLGRKVWFEHLDPEGVETHLHEICHVIMNPPGGNIEQLSEDVVLMPFERTIARQCLSKAGYDKVVQWQLNTQIEWWSAKTDSYWDALDQVPNYSRRWEWRNSFAALRRMGVIANGRVTWKKPDWRRATKELLQRGNLIGGY